MHKKGGIILSNIVAFLILAVVYYIGEFVGTKTKAWIPSVFVIACLFLAGYWTFFPKDIVELAGMGAPLGGILVIMLCITHMGTVISIKQLLQQWKVIVIALFGLAGMVALTWFICIPLVGREYVIAGLPPLTGGILAATMMNLAALERGLTAAAVLAIAMYVMQGFVGYPLTAVLLKMEGKTLLATFRKGGAKVTAAGEVDDVAGNMKVEEAPRKKLIPPMPEKYSTTAFILAKLAFSAFIASKLGAVTGLNQAVWALILGIIFASPGSCQLVNLCGFAHGCMIFPQNKHGIGVIFKFIQKCQQCSIFINGSWRRTSCIYTNSNYIIANRIREPYQRPCNALL